MNIYEGDYVKLKGENRITQVTSVIHIQNWDDKGVVSSSYAISVKMKKGKLYPIEEVEAYSSNKKDLMKKETD